MSFVPQQVFSNSENQKNDIDLIKSQAARPCPHRLKLMFFLDKHEDQRFDDPFVKHIENCRECRDQYLQMGREFEELNRILPWIKASPRDLELWKAKIRRHTEKKSLYQNLLNFNQSPLYLSIKSLALEPKWILILSISFLLTFYLVYS
jgi:hypothetical protein